MAAPVVASDPEAVEVPSNKASDTKVVQYSEGTIPSTAVEQASGLQEQAVGGAAELSQASVVSDLSDLSRSGVGGSGLGIVFSKTPQQGGYLIKRVKPGGPAAVSGNVFASDILVSIDGVSTVTLTVAELSGLVLGPEGSWASVVVQRGGSQGSRHTVTLVRGSAAADTKSVTAAAGNAPDQPRPSSGSSSRRLGLGIVFKADSEGRFLVKRLKPDGAASTQGGVEVGDVVLAVNGIETIDMTYSELSGVVMGEEGSGATLLLLRGGRASTHCSAGSPSGRVIVGRRSGPGEEFGVRKGRDWDGRAGDCVPL